MTSLRTYVASASLAALIATSGALAQDLTITNARILDGRGGVIESGTLTIADGRIASVSEGPAPGDAANVIDADGRTLLPGYIDSHRHLGGGTSPEALQAYLDAGFTTVLEALSPPGPGADATAALRQRIESGEIAGPRLKISGMIPVNNAPMPQDVGDPARADPARIPLAERAPAEATPPDQARAMVRDFAAKGFDNIKTILVASPGGPEVETLKAIAEEAHANGMRLITHTTSVEDTLVAVEAGPDFLVHTPHIGWVDEGDAIARIVAAGAPMATTLGVFTPYFGVEGDDLFRDMGAFPDDALHSAGQGPVNARLLANAGVVMAYGTDTSFSPRESLRHELRALGSVFSPADIVQMLTANAAIAADVEEETGALEPGKAGDVVMVDGDPLTDSSALLDVVLVLKNGVIVADKR